MRSYTVTATPPALKTSAAIRPAGPAPITAAVFTMGCVCLTLSFAATVA
jgi:hypothetical protein